MHAHLPAETPAGDVVAGITLIGDALDGAATVGLTSLSDRIETVRESFLATTLHDVRQPITLAEGSLHLADRWLTEPDPDSARVAEAVHDALLATTELVTMIDTLSDASRVAMGALNPDLEPASLEHVVRDVVHTLGPQGRARVRIEVEHGGRLIGMWDPSLLRRLVANLLGNALKYSPSDEPVEIAVGQGEGQNARLVVHDRGIGMAEVDLDRVFERFARTDRARQSGAAGLGLGLYACRGIVTAHGGTIEVKSDGHDLGTTVIVTLPILEDGGEDGERLGRRRIDPETKKRDAPWRGVSFSFRVRTYQEADGLAAGLAAGTDGADVAGATLGAPLLPLLLHAPTNSAAATMSTASNDFMGRPPWAFASTLGCLGGTWGLRAPPLNVAGR